MKTKLAVLCRTIFVWTFLCAPGFSENVTLTWEANTEPDLKGYWVNMRSESEAYGPEIPVGNVTTHTYYDLSPGTYFFTVCAEDESGNNNIGFCPEIEVVISQGDEPPPADPPKGPPPSTWGGFYWNCEGIAVQSGAGSVKLVEAVHPTGKTGNGILLSGGDQRAYLTMESVSPLAGSIMFWYRRQTASLSPYATLWAKSSGYKLFAAYRNKSDTSLKTFYNNVQSVFNIPSIWDGGWHRIHYAWDVSRDYTEIFVDGVSFGTGKTGGSPASWGAGETLEIGNASQGGYPGGGIYDELALLMESAAPDTQGPGVSITAPVAAGTFDTDEPSVDLAGAASDDVAVARVTWRDASGSGGTATGASAWSVSGIALVEGENIITVEAVDPSGNTGEATITVTHAPPDTEAPLVAFTAPVSSGVFETDAALIDISGDASDNRAVSSVSWRNSAGGSGTASGTTAWGVSGLPLAEGLNTITVEALDASENPGAATLKVVYTPPDTTPPSVSITVPAGGYVSETDKVDIGGIAMDDVAVASVSWSSSSGEKGSASGNETWSVSGIPLSEGENTVTVEAVDSSGNSGSAELLITYLPPEPPTAPPWAGGMYWSCEGTELDSGDGTVTVAGAGFSAGKSGNGLLITEKGQRAFVNLSNVPPSKGRISLWYRNTTPPVPYAVLFAATDKYKRFSLYRAGSSDTKLIATFNMARLAFTVPNIWDGEWHGIEFSWDTGADRTELLIDGTSRGIGSDVIDAPQWGEGETLDFGNDGAGALPSGGILDEVTISGS